MRDEEEEKLLRSVALQNAQSILQARHRAEEELLAAKGALELKTQELAGSLAMMRATLESTSDGILVTDDLGRVTDFNEKFVQIWRLPPEILEARVHQELLRFTSRRFKDPQQFLARIQSIYTSSPPESFDVLELADGSVFERSSRIQFVSERGVGRVWSFRDITDRRRVEEALQQQSDWLRITLASIGDGVITTDVDGRITSLNPVAAALTGWSADEALGVSLDRVFHILNEQTREPVENPATKALREGRVVGLANHTLLIGRDGAERAIDDSAAPLKDDKGNTLGVVLIFRDVTERRRAEETRLHLAAVVDSSDDAIVTKSLEGIIRSWNDGAKRIFGYTAEEVIGRPITILLPTERHHEETEILRRLRRGDRLDHFETVRITKDGRLIDVSVTASPMRDSSGRIIGASKIARDITERKRTERTTRFLADISIALAELSDTESTLQKVADLAVPSFADWCAVDLREPDGSVRRLAVAQTEGTKIHFPAERERPYPKRASNFCGVLKVLRTGQPEWSATIPDSLLAEFAADEDDLSFLRKLGLRSCLSVPLRSRGRTFGAITFAMAESGRAYDTADLRAAEDLAHRAVIAIENANLLAALRESDQRKDEFLAMLAHELRNPLAPIRNSVQILRAKAPPVRELQWATEVIDRQVGQMTRLVDDLLDVSRITRGKIHLQRERVELAAIVNNAVDTSRPLIEKWGHEFIVTMPPEPVYLEVDLTRISQVLLNLLNNAAKYTDQGGRIWLTVQQEGEHLLIRVKDTGIGIAADMLPHIFDMFTQIDRSLDRSQGGLGIGLTLVKRLVELHGGTVRALSDGPGQGSEFIVHLPMKGEAAESSPDDPASGQEDAGVTPKRRILVVDDNKDSADSLEMLLRMLGNEVLKAHDGLEAVEAAAAFQPDLVLLDIGLPKLNGYGAARRIRAAQGDKVVLIAVTGWGQHDDRRRSKEAGFDHHLTKPVDLDALHELLARAAHLGRPERRKTPRRG